MATSQQQSEEQQKSEDQPSSPPQPVIPPFSETPLNKFIYILLIILFLIAIFYISRFVQHKTDVGGWWNLFLGKTPQSQGFPKLKDDGKVETRLHLLAESLGIPPPASDQLVAAIASAVRVFVPPASLSSIAAKETGRAVKILLEKVQAHAGGGGPGFGGKASFAAFAASEGAADVDGVVNAFMDVYEMND